MKKLIALNIVLSVLVLLTNMGCHISIADKEHVVENIEKTYSVNAGGNLTIVSEFGSIDVRTAEREQVDIVFTQTTRLSFLQRQNAML